MLFMETRKIICGNIFQNMLKTLKKDMEKN